MKTVLLYRPNSEHATMVESYLRDFHAQTGKELPIMDIDSAEGMEICRLYDIVQYPTIIATDQDGHVQNIWSGDPLPLINEVSYYVRIV